jgi:hypothetical protein
MVASLRDGTEPLIILLLNDSDGDKEQITGLDLGFTEVSSAF